MRIPSTVPALIPVKDSSNVQAIGYNPKTNHLFVQFLSKDPKQYGTIYRYANVPEQIFNRFQRAPSKGMYVHAHVKNKYAYAKWTGFGWRSETVLRRNSARRRRRR